MKQKLLSATFAMACVTSMSFAQTREVSGLVTSSDGTPISGASISVVGANTATQTDGSGRFKISVNSGATLNVSYIGYTTQRVIIGNSLTLSIVLVEGDQSLDEVVVVGYGSTTKEAFTGTAKVVSGENIERKSVSNISQALAGEVSGVSVINGSGQPGTAATIRIRGFGSVNGNRSPLYVLDGVPFNGDLTTINPGDIESTTVLKDAAATAIYGSRGANGVILITTKKGRGKASFVEADVNVGTNMALLSRYDVIRNPEEYIALGWEGLFNVQTGTEAERITKANTALFSATGLPLLSNIWNVTTGADLIDPTTRKVKSGVTRKFDPENWEDYAFQNASRKDMNVRFGGSSDKANYYTSLGYLDDKGYSINSDFERFSARVNVDNKVKSWLNVGTNVGYTKTERNNAGQSEDSGSIFWFIDNMPSIYPLFERDANGDMIEDPIYGGYRYDYGERNSRRFGALTNSISDATNSTRQHLRNEVTANGYINFNIIEGLTFENSLGINYFHNKFTSQNSKFYGSSVSTKGSIGQTRTERMSYNLLNLLRYRKQFGLHSLEALAAHEVQDFQNNVMGAGKNQLVRDDSPEFDNAVVMTYISSYTDRYTLESYLSQVNYDYNGKYYFSGSLRRDGSSRFVNKPWGTFGSVGASWIVSKENFMQAQNVFDFLKYKISYGLIGDQSVGSYYPGLITYPISNLNDKPSIGSANVGNPDLTWETAKMFQTGVEFSIGNRINASIDYYVKNTDNLIFDRRVGPSIGYALIKVNDGQLRNQGLEFDLTGKILKSNDFYLDLNLNGETFKNKIVTMPIDPATSMPKVIDVQGSFGWAEGRSIYDFYMRDFVGVDPEDGKSTWRVFYTDNNNNGTFDSGEQIASLSVFENPDNKEILEGTTKTYSQATLHYINKTAIPKLRGAVNLKAGYKNIDLAVQFLYSFGGYSYDGAYASLMHSNIIGSNNWHTDIYDRWQKPGDITNVPRLSNNGDPNVTSVSTRFLTKSDYLALNNIRLTYNFSKSLLEPLGVQGLSIWVSGDNLWQHTQREGFYPSTAENGSSNTYRYSPLSTVTGGLRVKF
jgi:TonB-linked SusC/RagA family outer membrane protein